MAAASRPTIRNAPSAISPASSVMRGPAASRYTGVGTPLRFRSRVTLGPHPTPPPPRTRQHGRAGPLPHRRGEANPPGRPPLTRPKRADSLAQLRGGNPTYQEDRVREGPPPCPRVALRDLRENRLHVGTAKKAGEN